MIRIHDLIFSHGHSYRLCVPEIVISEGEKVAIIGRSGCGKTTLLNLLAGMMLPETGEIQVGSQRIDRLTDTERRRWRSRSVGFVFQEFELIEYLNVRDNILLPFDVQLGSRRPTDWNDRLNRLLSATDLADRVYHFPSQLSHGQRQRTALCRALITRPPVLLADEPTGSLDANTASQVFDLLVKQSAILSATLIMVTHDQSFLGRFDRVIDLDAIRGVA